MQSKFKSMRKIFVTVILALFATTLFAQNTITDPKKKIDFGFDIFYDIWQNMPDSMSNNGISLGNSIYVMYEKQIWTEYGRVIFALGGGITTHKLSTNTIIDTLYKTPTTFRPIGENVDYDKSKVVITYLDFMAEIRYKSPSNFRFALGAKIGFRLGSQTHYKGEHPVIVNGRVTTNGINENVRHKDVELLEKMRFGPTLKIGYGFLNLNVYYSLSKIFSEANGPELYPISVGLTFNPF